MHKEKVEEMSNFTKFVDVHARQCRAVYNKFENQAEVVDGEDTVLGLSTKLLLGLDYMDTVETFFSLMDKFGEFVALVRQSNLIVQYDIPMGVTNDFAKNYYTDHGVPINGSRVSLLKEKARRRAVDDSFYIDRIPAFEKKVSEYMDALQSENTDV